MERNDIENSAITYFLLTSARHLFTQCTQMIRYLDYKFIFNSLSNCDLS